MLAQLDDLGLFGAARLPGLLDPATCAAVAAIWSDGTAFRSRVDMARQGYGAGEYRYFAYPLPGAIEDLRARLYAALVPIANCWAARLGRPDDYPDTLGSYLARCHDAGQTRPTPLLLRYTRGDFNCLHRDVYGALAFPLQATVLLSRPGDDFAGGEFVLTEQRARRQSRAEVVPLAQGDAVIFANADRPVPGARGEARVTHRHGVSRIRSGTRLTLGLIFHDAT